MHDPRFAGEGEGQEYKTVYAMGSNCMIGDLVAVAKANYICNELKLDSRWHTHKTAFTADKLDLEPIIIIRKIPTSYHNTITSFIL